MDVYFDDFKITHTVGEIVAGGDYYPYGLEIEDRQITLEDYRYGYQGQFAEKDDETGWNHFRLREYDPVVGRWAAVDPKRQGFSSYWGMNNNPISLTDPDGGAPPSEFVNAKSGERRHINDGINIVVVIEDKHWNDFLKFFDMTSNMSIPSQRFGILSKFGDNYLAGDMIDFFDMHSNPEHLEWGTRILRDGNMIYPNSLGHTEGTARRVGPPTTGDPREAALLHTHAWPGDHGGPSVYDDHRGDKNVYNVVVDEKYIHFYNRGEYYISNLGNHRYRHTGTNFSIPRSSFGK